MKTTNKRSFSFGVAVGWFLFGIAVVYEATSLFTKGTPFIIDPDKVPMFELNDNRPFPESISIKPKDSITFTPSITSNATEDMYVFEKIVMPKYGNAGLYNITLPGWNPIEGYENGYEENGKWVVVLIYNAPLNPGMSTDDENGKITMVDMSVSDYAFLDDLSVESTAYGCGTDQDLDSAWDAIKNALGA